MDIFILVTFFVAFLSSIISGLSGGGGGFIMTPYYLLIGLTPQQIIASASVSGLGLGTSSLMAMRGKQCIDKRFLWPLLIITIAATLCAMFIVPHIKSQSFELVISLLLIILAPTLFIKKQSFQPGYRSPKAITFGYSVYAIILFASSLGSGLATLLFLPLLFLMGLSTLQANALRRLLMVVQAIVTFFIVLLQGYIVWKYAIASLVGCYAGGWIGTKIALKKGDAFAKYALAAIMIVSGIVLFCRSISK